MPRFARQLRGRRHRRACRSPSMNASSSRCVECQDLLLRQSEDGPASTHSAYSAGTAYSRSGVHHQRNARRRRIRDTERRTNSRYCAGTPARAEPSSKFRNENSPQLRAGTPPGCRKLRSRRLPEPGRKLGPGAALFLIQHVDGNVFGSQLEDTIQIPLPGFESADRARPAIRSRLMFVNPCRRSISKSEKTALALCRRPARSRSSSSRDWAPRLIRVIPRSRYALNLFVRECSRIYLNADFSRQSCGKIREHVRSVPQQRSTACRRRNRSSPALVLKPESSISRTRRRT